MMDLRLLTLTGLLAFTGLLAVMVFAVTDSDDNPKKEKNVSITQPGEEAAAREQHDCPALVRKICKDASGRCGPVYISGKDNADCLRIDREKIQRLCGGAADAKLYNSDGECIQPPVSDSCPADIESIRKQDIEMIYQCPGLFRSLCWTLCGPRYDQTDIREFYQTHGKPGLTCIDGSMAEMKEGESYSEDRNRHHCFSGKAEIHSAAGGARTWCVAYDKTHHDVGFGAFVQCVGRLRP